MNAVFDRLRSRLNRESFAAKVLYLAGGTALSQGIAVASAPLLTRLYSPTDFGLFAVYSSLLSVCSALASFRYEVAIPLPKSDDDAANVTVLAIALACAMSTVCAISVLLFSTSIATSVGAPAMARYLWLLPVGLFGYACYQSLSYWASRRGLFALIGYTKAAQGLAQATIQLVAPLARIGAAGLVVGYAISQFVGVASLWRRSGLPTSSIDRRRWPPLARTYRLFPLVTTWATLVDIVGVQAPALLFPKCFDLPAAGSFALAMRVLGLPSVFISQAVGQVFYPTVAQKDLAASREFIFKVSRVLLFMSGWLFSIVLIDGEFLFSWVFGIRWATAGRFAQILAPWLAVAFVTSPLSTFVIAQGKQREGFVFNVAIVIVRIVSILIGAARGSSFLAVMLYSASGVILYIAYWRWMLRLADARLLHFLGGSRRDLAIIATLTTILWVTARFIHPAVSVACFAIASIAVAPSFIRTAMTLRRQTNELVPSSNVEPASR